MHQGYIEHKLKSSVTQPVFISCNCFLSQFAIHLLITRDDFFFENEPDTHFRHIRFPDSSMSNIALRFSKLSGFKKKRGIPEYMNVLQKRLEIFFFCLFKIMH